MQICTETGEQSQAQTIPYFYGGQETIYNS